MLISSLRCWNPELTSLLSLESECKFKLKLKFIFNSNTQGMKQSNNQGFRITRTKCLLTLLTICWGDLDSPATIVIATKPYSGN